MMRRSNFVLRTGRMITSARPICRSLSSVNQFEFDEEENEVWYEKATEEERSGPSKIHIKSDFPLNDSNSTKTNVESKTSSFSSPSTLTYTGSTNLPITTNLHLFTPKEDTPKGNWPVFRLMDENGTFRDTLNDGFEHSANASHDSPVSSKTKNANEGSNLENSLLRLREMLTKIYPKHTKEMNKSTLLTPSKYPYSDTESDNTLLRCFTQMVRLREMDNILQNAQRQGRISFYMTCRGEEAMHLGAASALELEDTILAQYREAGLLMWRGFTLQQFTDQCFTNEDDLGKGRQMPIHYGSRALNYQTISSPLGTQIPQASGAAYRLKLEGKKAVAICFFGEGCSSTTDFHSGLNFAATLKCPVIFFCRNNGYAISTSVSEQYSGDGVVSRAPGYGMAAIRVDGNDVFAVSAAVREAREYAIQHSAPVLIEAMSYRQGHHSTSDDSLRYRSEEEVQSFAGESDPLTRFQHFLKLHTDMTDDDFKSVEEKEKSAVIDAMREAESKSLPPLEALFTDVYKDLPPSLLEQQSQLNEHVKKYPKHY